MPFKMDKWVKIGEFYYCKKPNFKGYHLRQKLDVSGLCLKCGVVKDIPFEKD